MSYVCNPRWGSCSSSVRVDCAFENMIYQQATKKTYCVEVDAAVGVHGAKPEKVGAKGRRNEAGVGHCSLLATFRTNVFQCRGVAVVVSFKAGVGRGSGSLMIRLVSIAAY